MKQSLQLKLGQQLTMTPQLQQAIRLLQLSTLDLQAEIQEALDSNPMLEVSEDEQNTDTNDSGSNDSKAADSGDQADTRASADDRDERGETAENSTSNDADSDNSDWSDSIPEDLPVDTSWDDV